LPENAVTDLAGVHNQLGNIYGDASDLDCALPHFREAIRYREAQDNLYEAARARRNVAAHLARVGRFGDALAYANAALRNYQTFGERAATDIQRTQQLIAYIEQNV